ALRLEDLTLALVRLAQLFVTRRGVGEQDVVERRGGGRERRDRVLALARARQAEQAARDALQVARALGGGAVDQERTLPRDAEPDRVVLLDVADVVERRAEVVLAQ